MINTDAGYRKVILGYTLTDLEMLDMPNDKFDISVTHKLTMNFE